MYKKWTLMCSLRAHEYFWTNILIQNCGPIFDYSSRTYSFEKLFLKNHKIKEWRFKVITLKKF